MFRCLAYTEQPTNIISSNGMLAGGGYLKVVRYELGA